MMILSSKDAQETDTRSPMKSCHADGLAKRGDELIM